MVAFFILFGILPAISLREWARDLFHDYVALHVKREPNPELRCFPLRRWLRTMDPMELLFGLWGLLVPAGHPDGHMRRRQHRGARIQLRGSGDAGYHRLLGDAVCCFPVRQRGLP